jgi:hypothetical protein
MGLEIERLTKQLAECQAREKTKHDALIIAAEGIEVGGKLYNAIGNALTLPSDSTALDAMLKQAKREALLEAADYLLKRGYQGNGFELSHDLRRMALEDHPMNRTL